jgi:hypothetical protein
MKRSSYIGFYLVFTGVGLIVVLIKTLLTGDFSRESSSASFHLASEFIMTIVSIIGGFFLVLGRSGGRRLSLFALGMMLYSVINKTGYYWKTEQTRLLIVFALLTLLSLVSFLVLLKDKRFSSNYKGHMISTGFSTDD